MYKQYNLKDKMEYSDKNHFRVRTAAIILSNNKLLLVKHRKNDREYWLLPGGGVKYGESLAEALKRELYEELDLNVEIEDIVFLNDSIPVEEGRHILNIYFNCKIIESNIMIHKDDRLIGYAFVDIEQIENLLFYPNIKKELLDYLKDKKAKKIYLGNRWDK